MSFVCCLDITSFAATHVKRVNSRAVLVPIGYDDEDGRSFFLFVTLDVIIADDGLELGFSVFEHDPVTDSEHHYWSGKDTSFIPKEARSKILDLLFETVRSLISEQNQGRVFLCTRDGSAPSKANRKFILLAKLFEDCGYTVRTADPYHGQQCWWMERNPVTSH